VNIVDVQQMGLQFHPTLSPSKYIILVQLMKMHTKEENCWSLYKIKFTRYFWNSKLANDCSNNSKSHRHLCTMTYCLNYFEKSETSRLIIKLVSS